MKTILSLAALATTFAFGGILTVSPASADTLYTLAGPTTEIGSPGTIGATFDAGAGPGVANFTIDGYDTLDGQNADQDTFTLSVNGTAVLSGTWDLGGGGGNVVFFEPNGTSIVTSTPGIGAGGTAVISVPISLISGSNSLTFAYAGADQGLGDEGWGLQDVSVTGNPFVAGVPEPATWALTLMGFGGLGAMLRRRGREMPSKA